MSTTVGASAALLLSGLFAGPARATGIQLTARPASAAEAAALNALAAAGHGCQGDNATGRDHHETSWEFESSS